jgi:N-acetylmuramoyl-L-alanine amidase
VAVHYSGMNSDEQRLHTNCATRVRGMQRFHIETRGWLDVAYSHVFCGHGYVFVGRGFGVRSAANGTNEANDRYHAVCFLGDDSAGRADVTPQARTALEQLIAEYRRRYPRAQEVRPHSDFVATACPGDELRALIRRFQREERS